MSGASVLIEEAVKRVAEGLKVELDAAQLVEVTGKVAGYLADAVSGQAWRAAKAAGQAKADAIKTEDDAELAQRAR